MRILSIDFDYFQNVSQETLQAYPDGVDVSTGLSEYTWGSHYASNGNELSKVTIREEELQLLKDLLLQQDRDIPVVVMQSHKGIYDFVHYIADEGDYLEICNIDMHHDFINDNDEPDCGNWCGFLAREYEDFSMQWICNPVSKEMYSISDSSDSKVKQLLAEELPETIRAIGKNNAYDCIFDAVYLCRSDNWSVPHLDSYFTDLCQFLNENFNAVSIQPGVETPRFQYAEIAKAMQDSMRNFYRSESDREI